MKGSHGIFSIDGHEWMQGTEASQNRILEVPMSLSSDIKRVLEIFNATKEHPRPYHEFEKVPLRSPERSFDREEGSSASSSGSRFELPESPGGSRATTPFVLPPAPGRKVFRPLAPPQATIREPEEWPGIKAVVSDLVPALPVSPTRWPVMFLTSFAGGSGRSTMASVLIVENARQGRPCLLIDLNESSMYPYLLMAFRQEESVRTGSSWTFYTYKPTGVPIIVIRPDPEDVQEIAAGSARLSTLRDDLVAQASSLFAQSGGLDPLVLIDGPPMTRPFFEEATGVASLILSPIKPDFPSLLSVKEMEKSFDRIERNESRYCERFYLLNRFVSNHPLHQDISEVFRQILSRKLCPFVIPDDPAVEVALAKGESLLDVFSENAATISMTEAARWIFGKFLAR
jgi:cellulose biosynthesis protein BcsQ